MGKIIFYKTGGKYSFIKVLEITLIMVLFIFVSIAGAAPFAYIPCTESSYNGDFFVHQVYVIDVAKDTIVATVPINITQPIGGIAVSPDGSKVYLTEAGDGVSVIDTATNTVTAKIYLNDPEGVVAVSPDGKKIYVVNLTNGDSNFCVIDTATYKVISALDVEFGSQRIAISPDGTKVYLTNSLNDNVSVIDTVTNTVTDTVQLGVGLGPWGVVVSPDGTKAYVGVSDGLCVINTITNTVIDTVHLGILYSGEIAVSPDGKNIYMSNHNYWSGSYSGTVYVIDTSSYTVIATVPVGLTPGGIAVTADGAKVYVVNSGSHTVSVINTITNTVVDTLPVGKWPVAYGQFIGGSTVQVPESTNLYLSNLAPINKDHGSSITYMLFYSNFGNLSASNVILEDKLPDVVEFNSASDGGVYTPSTRKVRWDIGSVSSKARGYRTLNVSIPEDVPVGTVIVNNVNISTSDTEINYNDNKAQAKTTVTGLILPPNVGVEPNNGGIGTPSVYWTNPITFSYHNTGLPVTGVNITIHSDDGLPDITGTMTNGTNMSDWTYTTTFYPRHGKSTVTYTKQFDPNPYTPSYDVRGEYGDKVTADEIYNYIKVIYPQSPMLSEPDIGSRFINAANTYGIDPIFLVSLAEIGSQFGTVGWGADHPEAHNAFMYGVYDNNTIVDQINCASSWGDMVNRVACAIATGPNYFKKGHYTIEAICRANDNIVYDNVPNDNFHSTYTLYTLSPPEAALGGLIGIDYVGFTTRLPGWVSFLTGGGTPPIIGWLVIGMQITIGVSNGVFGEEHTRELEDVVNHYIDPRWIVEYAERWAYGIYSLSFPIYVDPAGYIYDVDTGQRISGASVWLQRPDSNGGWQNVSTGENPPVSQPDTNPLISDKDGMYQWDTLPGSYRVHVESPGYEPADSIMVSVPPPVFDLHVGLNHIYDPNVPPILPVANFSNDISSGYAPLSVQFTDLSENVNEIKWEFGDGTSSTDRYPIHTYSKVGTYTVTLTASNGNGVDSKTGVINVQAVPIYPVANFVCNVTNGYAPLSVQFTDLSENVNGIKWEFGDGNNSTDKSPVHTYFVTGNYIATLTVRNDNGTSSYFATINVSEEQVPVVPVSNFSSNVTEGYAPLTVQFRDLSKNATHLEWNFGDGSSNVSDANPEHIFNSNGLFNVVLTASNDNGSDSKSMTINVTSKPLLPVFPGCTKAPVDPNNDGLYEDINGNARLDFADVVVYYNYMAWITQSGLVVYFDYNKNGRIDFNDVVKLYNMH